MNLSKISKRLLNSVSALGLNKQKIFVSTNNFFNTKLFLEKYKYKYCAYRFANCFCLLADFFDISILSDNEDVKYIFDSPIVKFCKEENKFVNLHNLTNGKFLGQNQTICFIDTGIYPHLDFILPKNRIIKFIDLVNHRLTPYDDNGHGTFVAGVACSAGVVNKSNIGFSPRANMIVIKALNSEGNSDSNLILDAMQWVYENCKVYNISVVCMSFGADFASKFDPLSHGAEALWKRGITIVAAAGNSGPNEQTIKSPGNNPYIITVGGLDKQNLAVAPFSSRGPTMYGHKPDLIAPAVNLTSCNNGLPFYCEMSGTSVATPIVAGICADVKSRYPKLNNIAIKKLILSNCTKLTGNVDNEGAGYINFGKFSDIKVPNSVQF